MDTMTYASVAAIPESVANSTRRLLVPEVELIPLDLSHLGKSIRAEISRVKRRGARAGGAAEVSREKQAAKREL
jgi:hypothetical protein